ncbi:MAG: type VI secretion system baseplate subunit TssK [bacterium]|nr:type VI secretion system baseplate subunit TssK [bacterium]
MAPTVAGAFLKLRIVNLQEAHDEDRVGVIVGRLVKTGSGVELDTKFIPPCVRISGDRRYRDLIGEIERSVGNVKAGIEHFETTLQDHSEISSQQKIKAQCHLAAMHLALETSAAKLRGLPPNSPVSRLLDLALEIRTVAICGLNTLATNIRQIKFDTEQIGIPVQHGLLRDDAALLRRVISSLAACSSRLLQKQSQRGRIRIGNNEYEPLHMMSDEVATDSVGAFLRFRFGPFDHNDLNGSGLVYFVAGQDVPELLDSHANLHYCFDAVTGYIASHAAIWRRREAPSNDLFASVTRLMDAEFIYLFIDRELAAANENRIRENIGIYRMVT